MAILAPVRPVFRAVVSTVVPEAIQLDEQGWREVEDLVEMTLRDRTSAVQRQVRLFLRTIQWLCLFRFGRRFTSLNAEQRARVLVYFQDHPIELIRCGFWGIRTLAFLGYYGRAEALRAIGYAASSRGWEMAR